MALRWAGLRTVLLRGQSRLTDHGFSSHGLRGYYGRAQKKKAALFAHKSQNGEGIYREHHEHMENFRGREAGTAAAEAFVHLARLNSTSRLPGLG